MKSKYICTSLTREQIYELLIMFKGNEITADQVIEIMEIINEEGGNPADIARNRGIRASDS